MKPVFLNRPNVWLGATLAVLTSLAIAPEAIARPAQSNSADTTMVISQAERQTITATILDASTREDNVRVRLPNGDIRMLSVSSQDILRLGLSRGVEVILNMEGNHVLTMSRMMTIEPQETVNATVLDTSTREDTVRVRLPDGDIRMLSLSSQEQLRLGLERGSEVTLNMRGNQILTMARNNISVPVMESDRAAF